MDPLDKDKSENFLNLEETVDGEYQNFKQKGGKYTREKFNKYPETAALLNLSDDDTEIKRGGRPSLCAYKSNETTGKPIAILASSVKGYGIGS